MGQREVGEYRRKEVGFIWQQTSRNLFPYLTAVENVALPMRQLITTVSLEQILVIGVGMALGTWMGGRLGATIIPFLGHDDFGGQVVPPFVIEINWGALLLTYAAMFAVFAAIILVVVWFIHRISLHRILRMGEL